MKAIIPFYPSEWSTFELHFRVIPSSRQLGVTLQQINQAMAEKFRIPYTPSLREEFSRTHELMSGSDPAGPQYPPKEQYEMYLLCEVVSAHDKSELDQEKTEDNLLELIQFLTEHGVRVPEILYDDVRNFGERTLGVSLRLHSKAYKERRQQEARKTSETLKPRFLQPALV